PPSISPKAPAGSVGSRARSRRRPGRRHRDLRGSRRGERAALPPGRGGRVGDGRSAAVVGVGYTPFSRDSGRSVLDLARAASGDALADAGLRGADVDGIGSFMVMHDSVKCQAVATTL